MSAVSSRFTPASRAASITARVPSRSSRRPKLLQPSPATVTSSEPIFRRGSSVIIEPGVYQPPRDRDRGRYEQRLGRAVAGGGDLLAREPAHVLELVVADGRLAARVVGEEAEHERARERPRLRARVAHAAHRDAGLLEHLARHGLLERLARLDEASERRVAARRPARLAPHQRPLAV